jgi:integrase
MASVYEKRGTWYANYKDATGRRRNVATKATTKTEARRLAQDLERQAERARFGLEALPTDSALTLGELCSWWLRERCPAGSVAIETQRLGKHVHRTSLADLPVRMVTTAALESRFREMERDGLGPSSVNGLRTTLHPVYARAKKAGLWTGANPATEVERRRVPKKVHATLKADEVPVLLAHVPDEWRNLFAAAIYTGMRKGELFGLRRSDVDLAGDLITVARSYDRVTTKGGHADVIPIATPLRPYLVAALDESDSDLVFPAPDGSMRSPEADPQKVLRHALARAGLVLGYEHVCRRCKARGTPHAEQHLDAVERRCPACGMRLWPKALPRPMRFHDLRHTTATLLLRAGVPLHHVQRIMRHRDVRLTTETYGHLVADDLRSAVEQIAPVSWPEAGPRSTRLLPGLIAAKDEGRGPPVSRAMPRPSKSGRQDLNLRPLGPEDWERVDARRGRERTAA